MYLSQLSNTHLFFSPLNLTELAIPYLEKTKGNIINVGGITAQQPNSNMPFHSISKAALDHFARNYSAILAPKGIRINNLNPGAVDTEIINRLGLPKEMVAKVSHRFFGRLGIDRV